MYTEGTTGEGGIIDFGNNGGGGILDFFKFAGQTLTFFMENISKRKVLFSK